MDTEVDVTETVSDYLLATAAFVEDGGDVLEVLRIERALGVTFE